MTADIEFVSTGGSGFMPFAETYDFPASGFASAASGVEEKFPLLTKMTRAELMKDYWLGKQVTVSVDYDWAGYGSAVDIVSASSANPIGLFAPSHNASPGDWILVTSASSSPNNDWSAINGTAYQALPSTTASIIYINENGSSYETYTISSGDLQVLGNGTPTNITDSEVIDIYEGVKPKFRTLDGQVIKAWLDVTQGGVSIGALGPNLVNYIPTDEPFGHLETSGEGADYSPALNIVYEGAAALGTSDAGGVFVGRYPSFGEAVGEYKSGTFTSDFDLWVQNDPDEEKAVVAVTEFKIEVTSHWT